MFLVLAIMHFTLTNYLYLGSFSALGDKILAVKLGTQEANLTHTSDEFVDVLYMD